MWSADLTGKHDPKCNAWSAIDTGESYARLSVNDRIHIVYSSMILPDSLNLFFQSSAKSLVRNPWWKAVTQTKGASVSHLNAICIHQTGTVGVCMPASASRGKAQLELVQVPSLSQGYRWHVVWCFDHLVVLVLATLGCCQ